MEFSSNICGPDILWYLKTGQRIVSLRQTYLLLNFSLPQLTSPHEQTSSSFQNNLSVNNFGGSSLVTSLKRKYIFLIKQYTISFGSPECDGENGIINHSQCSSESKISISAKQIISFFG